MGLLRVEDNMVARSNKYMSAELEQGVAIDGVFIAAYLLLQHSTLNLDVHGLRQHCGHRTV